MSGYTRLFSSILASSIWSEPDPVRIVWITMLAMADKYGMVTASIVGLAHQARKTVEEAERAVAVLSAPDRYSKNPANEGRRIEAVPSIGWRVLNYEEYRNGMDNDPEAAANRERQRRHREKLKEEAEALHNVTSRDSVGGVGVDSDSKKGVQGETKPAKPTVDLPFASDSFAAVWSQYLEHRTRIRKPMTPYAQKLALAKLPKVEADAVRWINTAIEKGWQGIYNPDSGPAAKAKNAEHSSTIWLDESENRRIPTF